MKITRSERINGEMLARELTGLAEEYYETTDPCDVVLKHNGKILWMERETVMDEFDDIQELQECFEELRKEVLAAEEDEN